MHGPRLSVQLLMIMTPFYEPFEPTSYVCQPAAALFITKAGEVEIFSRECSKLITRLFPKYSGTGWTLSLLDKKIILLGHGDPGSNSNQEDTFVSIDNHRDGLFAMKHSEKKVLFDGAPFEHVSLVSRNELFVLGGEYQTNRKYTKDGDWKKTSLKQDGSNFLPDFIAACSVKIDVNVHIIFGGKKSPKGVIKIDTDLEEATEMKPTSLERDFHSCQLVSNKIVILSGGLTWRTLRGGYRRRTIQRQDELYDIESEKVVKVLDVADSLRRYNHKTIKMGDEIFAIGGKARTRRPRPPYTPPPLKVKVFNSLTETWYDFSRDLLSSATDQLVLTPYALSSLDCVRECSCGTVTKNTRIFDGSEAEVAKILKNLLQCYSSAKVIPLDCSTSPRKRHQTKLPQLSLQRSIGMQPQKMD